MAHLRPGDRAVFIGLPRSGKSNLLMVLLQGVQRFVIIDTKMHPGEWVAWARKTGVHVTANPDDITARDKDNRLLYPRIVFQVSTRAMRDRAGWYKPGRVGNLWTRALEAIKARRAPTVVVFDEVLQSLPSGGAHPMAHELFEQGRAFGISCWSGTQLANRMTTLVPRLSEHCFSFRILHGKDRELLRDARGIDCEELGELEPFHFGYHQLGDDRWTICAPVPNVIDGAGRAPSKNLPEGDSSNNAQLQEAEA